MSIGEVVAQGTIQVADYGYLFAQLGKAHHTVYEALREYITNALEAGAKSVEIVYYYVGTNPYLAILDDGRSFTPQRLKEVAEGICASEKRGLDEYTGEHAIGIFSAAAYLRAQQVVIVAKPPDQGQTFALVFSMKERKITYSIEERVPAKGYNTGVYLYLTGEEARSIRQTLTRVMAWGSQPSLLATNLGKAYRSQLLDGKVKIILRRRGGGIPRERRDEGVAPVRYAGIPINLSSLQIGRHRVKFNLYLSTATVGKGPVVIQHVVGPVADDITKLPGLGPIWAKYQGEVQAPFLKRSAGGIDLNDRSWVRFRNQLVQEIEPQLKEFYQEVTQGTFTSGEAGKLRDVFRKVLGGESLTLPTTYRVAGQAHEAGDKNGSSQTGLVRSDLGDKRGQIKQKGTGREPYAELPDGATPVAESRPISKKERKQVAARKVSGLQWKLGAFSGADQNLTYKVDGGTIYINTAHKHYLDFVGLKIGGGKGLGRKVLKLLWMASITCQVIVDLNFPSDQHRLDERRFQYLQLYTKVGALLLR